MIRTKIARPGLTFIEVIACTAMVAAMIVPIASVIRSTGQTIHRIEADSSTADRLQSTLHWLRDQLRDSTLGTIRTRRIDTVLADGRSVSIVLRGDDLVVDEGGNQSVLCSPLRDVAFTAISAQGSTTRIGLSLALTADDPTIGGPVTLHATIFNDR